MPSTSSVSDLAEFQQHLIGAWSNEGVPRDVPDQPLSYCVMPLPQTSDQPGRPASAGRYSGFILKNFTFTETVAFHGPDAVAGPLLAPNRGGRYQQNSYALFYDQRVLFAEGPGTGTVVHEENGAWLYCHSVAQPIGPYPMGQFEPGPVVPQPPAIEVAKQISVPHGNSVLALGHFDPVLEGAPVIPPVPPPFPRPADLPVGPYITMLAETEDFENPTPPLTLDPTAPLRQAIAKIGPTHFLHWRVTTDPVAIWQGQVTNIPFEQRRARVTAYSAEYWLLSTDGGNSFGYFSYAQNIVLQITIAGQIYEFPHITSNTVARVPSG